MNANDRHSFPLAPQRLVASRQLAVWLLGASFLVTTDAREHTPDSALRPVSREVRPLDVDDHRRLRRLRRWGPVRAGALWPRVRPAGTSARTARGTGVCGAIGGRVPGRQGCGAAARRPGTVGPLSGDLRRRRHRRPGRPGRPRSVAARDFGGYGHQHERPWPRRAPRRGTGAGCT